MIPDVLKNKIHIRNTIWVLWGNKEHCGAPYIEQATVSFDEFDLDFELQEGCKEFERVTSWGVRIRFNLAAETTWKLFDTEEECIAWAREKIERTRTRKPRTFDDFEIIKD